MANAPIQHHPRGWRPPVKTREPHYGSATHRAFRAVVMARCGGRCQAMDAGVRCAAAAVVADHIVARKDGGSDDPVLNGRGLCRLHDNRRHSEKAARR